MTVTMIDPATGDPLATYEETGPDELDAILERAHTAAASWRLTPPAQRAEALGRLASALQAEREELALLATREMGKARGT
jgi:acyl-CoA reductase-like NAD-dependent aldehyde dehydrogenase